VPGFNSVSAVWLVPLTERNVGRPIPPRDLTLKVTGTALYNYDWSLPGVFESKLVTSTVPHAKLVRINKERAEEIPGVVAILTGKDMPFRVGMYAGDRDLLAMDKVRWVGHPVALVVADSLESAERAAELVDVEYEPLPTVFDPVEAVRPEAPILHEKMAEYKHAPVFHMIPGTNIANKFQVVRGDVEQGFKQADLIVEDEFEIGRVSPAYMETQTVIAHYKMDGSLEVWTNSQSPFVVRQILSASLRIPCNSVIVKTPFIGGSFGGKGGLGWEALVAMASKLVGYKPVRLVLSRKETFASAVSREGVVANVKAGFTKEGKCLAYKVRFIVDAGGYADYTVNVARAIGYSAEGVYEVPNIYSESLAVYTNKPPTIGLRGFGYPESNWVVEQVFERAAKKLGIESSKIRRINLLRPGESHTATGELLREDAGNPRKVLQELLDELKWDEKLQEPTNSWKMRVRGIALGMKGPAQPPTSSSSAIVKFNEDATIDLSIGTGDMGQGTPMALTLLVADQFGLPAESVRVDTLRDTSKNAYTWQTVGSRALFSDGLASLRACADAKSQILDLASQVMRLPKEELEISDGAVRAKGRPSLTMPLKEFVFGYTYPNGNTIGGPIIGRGKYVSSLNTFLDPNTGQGIPTIFHTFGGAGVEIEVDLTTGAIELIKAVSVFDVGKAINPLTLKTQLSGGFVMGMSIALFEQMKFDEQGWVTNPNFTSYYVARMKDIPKEFVARFVETPQLDGPLGARGIGEMSMISVASAISNAIFNATGVKLNNLPMNPESVWTAFNTQRPDLVQAAMERYTDFGVQKLVTKK